MNNHFLSAGWAKKWSVGRSDYISSLTLFLHKLECTGKKSKGKSQSHLIQPVERSTGNNLLSKGGLTGSQPCRDSSQGILALGNNRPQYLLLIIRCDKKGHQSENPYL